MFAAAPSCNAIHNARVIPVSGPAIPRANIILRNGLIEAVGAEVAVPADAWVIEGDGLTVYPGLIDALSTFGIPDAAPVVIPGGGRGGAPAQQPQPVQPTPVAPANSPARGPEDRPYTTSWIRAADLVRPTDRRIEAARAEGFTTAVTFPAARNLCGTGRHRRHGW